ncbi:MAG: sulfopyruvate decarboxylase [Thermodesulfobacteriota bacterium]
MMSKEVARQVLAALKSAGIDFVAFLPDTALIELDRMVADDPDLISVPVANEGDGIAACGGAWLGGKRPAMIMENAGLFLATYALMRSSISFGFPVLLVMSYRGEFKEARWFSVPNGWASEPLLKALRIPYAVVRRRAEIAAAIENVQSSLSSQQYPAGILFGGETIW